MTRSPVLFRCDGSAHAGWEHMYQCLTYAAALQRRKRATYFLSAVEPASLAGLIHRNGSEWVASDCEFGTPEDASAVAREVYRTGCDAVVIAARTVPADYVRSVRATGTAVILLDTESRVALEADLVIDPLMPPTGCRPEPGGQLLSGGRYAVVRPIFRRHRPLRAQEPASPPFRGLIAFGDDDTRGEAAARIEEVFDAGKVERLSVVARAHQECLPALREQAQASGGRLEVITETGEVGLRLGRVHFALTSGDSWSMEMACVGIPQLILSQQPRHERNARRLDEVGAATHLGPCERVTARQLGHAVNLLLSDPLERLGMSRCARSLVDGRGPDRIVNGLEVTLSLPQAGGPLRVAA